MSDDALAAPWLDAPRLLRRLLVQAKSGDADASVLCALRSARQTSFSAKLF